MKLSKPQAECLRAIMETRNPWHGVPAHRYGARSNTFSALVRRELATRPDLITGIITLKGIDALESYDWNQ